MRTTLWALTLFTMHLGHLYTTKYTGISMDSGDPAIDLLSLILVTGLCLCIVQDLNEIMHKQ